MLCNCKLTSCCRFPRFNCSLSEGKANAQHLGGCQTNGLASTNPSFFNCDLSRAMVVWGRFPHCGRPLRSTCLRQRPQVLVRGVIWRSVRAPKKSFLRLRAALNPAWKPWSKALNNFSEAWEIPRSQWRDLGRWEKLAEASEKLGTDSGGDVRRQRSWARSMEHRMLSLMTRWRGLGRMSW